MNTYQVYADISADDQWEDISVESILVNASNCKEAKELAYKQLEPIEDHFYIWDVTEDDKVEDE